MDIIPAESISPHFLPETAPNGAAVTAYLPVRFLMRFFHTNRLTPFAIYCFCAGLAMTIYFAV